jgi:hypothetical protein
MEAAALTPPPRLEKIVLALIPPCAREAVAGDLWETYSSPRQYALEALRTVPLVVLSQMRRNLNLPLLLLQFSLICFCLNEMAAAVLLPVLMLRDAYQAAARPCPHHAMRAAILMALVALAFLQVTSFSVYAALDPTIVRPVGTSLLFAGLMLPPLMGLFRTGLIMDGDRRLFAADHTPSVEALAGSYRAFARRARWHNMLEGAGLLAAAAVTFHYLPTSSGIVLMTAFLLAAFYLLLDGAPRALAPRLDFTSLRAHFQRELTRRQHLRRFLWWLWFAPVLTALGVQAVEHYMAAGKPMLAVFAITAAALLCFLIAALNREYGGRVREQVGTLDRMREKLA